MKRHQKNKVSVLNNKTEKSSKYCPIILLWILNSERKNGAWYMFRDQDNEKRV